MKIFSTALFIAVCSFVHAAKINVSSLSDINSATPQPGDTLVMANGPWTDVLIELNFNGTESAPIVLIPQKEGAVTITGNSQILIGGSYTEVHGLKIEGVANGEGEDIVKFKADSEAEYCRLTNCYFFENNPSDIETGYKWVSLYGEHNRVDHCWFEGKYHRGTTLVVWLSDSDPKPNYHLIDHNYFTRPVYTSGSNEAETIRIGDSKTSLTHSYTTVEYNFFEECDGEIEVISNKSCYNTYRYNTFYNNSAILTLRHGHHCTVEGNYFFGNGNSSAGGVRIIGVGHKVIGNYFEGLNGSPSLRCAIVMMGGVDGFGENDATNRYVAAQDAVVAFNTVVNCKYGIYIGSDKASSDETYDAPFDCNIDNNIFYDIEKSAVAFEKDEIASFSYNGNIYYETSLGKASSDGFANTDPLLSAYSNFEPAHIQSGSPAIDAATGSYSLVEDFDGHARTDGSYDVGCDEYSTESINRQPVLKTQTGPCWMNPDACGEEYVPVDCNGVEGGDAAYDNCGVCAGGETGVEPNTSCEQDCNGDWDGTASIDDCGVCAGGNTGIEENACQECIEVQDSGNDGNLPANVLDGDPDSRWSSEGEGQYIEFCLGDPVNLKSIEIAYFKGNERSSTFHVEVSSDGVNWTRVLENQESSGATLDKESYTLNAENVSKLKVIGMGNSASAWNSITEVSWTVNSDIQIDTQTINLKEGWNLVSLYVEPELCRDARPCVSTVFPNAVTVKTFDDFYSSTQLDYLNSLTTIEAGTGYLVYNSIDEAIEISGKLIDQSGDFAPVSGWNLIGVPSSSPIPVSDYPDALIIKDFDLFYEKDNENNSLINLIPGEAYFLFK